MPLDKLVISEQQVSEELLEAILDGYVLLAKDTKRAVLTPQGEGLPSRAKVLLVLAAQHAWRFLTEGEERDSSLTVRDTEDQTGLPGNTVRPKLKALKDEHIVQAPSRGVYRLPPTSLLKVRAEIDALRSGEERKQKPPGKSRRRRKSQHL